MTQRRLTARRKLPARYTSIVMPLVLSIFMTFIVSGVATFKSIGFTPTFLQMWMSAWLLSWIIAFPALLLVLPVVRRVVAAIVESADS